MSNDRVESYERWLAAKTAVVDSMQRVQTSSANQRVLMECVQVFLQSIAAHAAFQSDDFYRKLRFFYKENPAVLNILDFLENDLKQLRVELFVFGENYAGDSLLQNKRRLSSDFLSLSRVVSQRLLLEEDQLAAFLQRIEKVDCQA